MLVDFAPPILATNPHCCMRHWAEFATARECLRAGVDVAGRRFLPRGHGRTHPEVGPRRCEIREDLLAAFRGQGPPARGDLPAFWRNWNVNRGALVLRERSRFDGKVEPNDAASFFPPNWACDPLNQDYLRRFLKLADDHGCTSTGSCRRSAPSSIAGRERLGLEALHTRVRAGILAQFPSVTVVDGRDSGYDHEAFNDAVHLNGQGDSNLTEDLATLLKGAVGIRGLAATAHLPGTAARRAPGGSRSDR